MPVPQIDPTQGQKEGYQNLHRMALINHIEPPLQELFKAMEEGRPVIAPDGKKCYVVKWKNGRAKIRRYTGKAIAQAWVPIAKLRIA